MTSTAAIVEVREADQHGRQLGVVGPERSLAQRSRLLVVVRGRDRRSAWIGGECRRRGCMDLGDRVLVVRHRWSRARRYHAARGVRVARPAPRIAATRVGLEDVTERRRACERIAADPANSSCAASSRLIHSERRLLSLSVTTVYGRMTVNFNYNEGVLGEETIDALVAGVCGRLQE